MSATLSPNVISVGDIVQYSDLMPWEDVEVIGINTWEFEGKHGQSYNIKFLSDDQMACDIDWIMFLRRKPALFDQETM